MINFLYCSLGSLFFPAASLEDDCQSCVPSILDAIKAATEKLQQVVQDASQDIYKAAQEAQAAGQAGGAEPDGNADAGQAEEAKKDEGPIIDAEVVEEKKD